MTKRTKRSKTRKPASEPAKASRATRRKDGLASPGPRVKVEDPKAADPGDTGLDRADRILRHASRTARWASSCNKAIIARADLDEAISVLAELRGEFEEWRDSMPENLHGSPTYEKLDAVCDLDIDRDAVLTPLDFLDEADGMDLPLGFGRD